MCNTISHFHGADNATSLQMCGQRDSMLAGESNAVSINLFGGMNLEPAAEASMPGAVFDVLMPNVLMPGDDKPRPWLFDAECFHSAKASQTAETCQSPAGNGLI